MAMLTQRELTSIRAVAAGALDELCAIQTRTTVADGQGGVTETWTNTITRVPCRLIPDTRHTQDQSGNTIHAVTNWLLLVAYSTPISAGQRVVKGGHTYEVQSVEDTQSERALRRAYLRRVQ